jgi:hypothetical protein
MIRRFALAIVAMVAGLLCVPGGAIAAAPSASVIAVKPGNTTVDLVVELPRSIDTASRNGAGWSIDTTLTYVSGAGTVETLGSGQVLVKNTSFLSSVGPNADTAILTLLFGARPPPGSNPAYGATAELFEPGGTLIGTTSTPSF